MVIIGQYFQRRRALATGLATAGGSVGTLVLPMFFSYAIKNYGFHGAMLIYAGLTLHAIPAAMLLRPITFYDVKRRGVSVFCARYRASTRRRQQEVHNAFSRLLRLPRSR
jgi:MFS family permease